MKFRVLIELDENGVFVATVPELPGCISQGKTRDEAISNIKDAVEGYLVSLKKHNEPMSPSIMEEIENKNIQSPATSLHNSSFKRRASRRTARLLISSSF